jgi:hypothetical protein
MSRGLGRPVALLHCARARAGGGAISTCHGQLVERDGQSPARRLLSGQLVMAPSKVLDEGMAADDHPLAEGRCGLLLVTAWSCGESCRLDCEDVPLLGHALERVDSPILEADPRARHQILHGRGDRT